MGGTENGRQHSWVSNTSVSSSRPRNTSKGCLCNVSSTSTHVGYEIGGSRTVQSARPENKYSRK